MNIITEIMDAMFADDLVLVAKLNRALTEHTQLIQEKHNFELEKIEVRGNRKRLHKMLDSGDLRNVIFQNINNDFAYGQYGYFDVMIMRKNGYVNATKLYKDAGKNFSIGAKAIMPRN